jgi:hypothetical protein
MEAVVSGILRRHPRPLAIAVVPILALVAVVTFPARSAAASDGHVTLQLLPAEMTLSAGELATIDLVISNATASPVKVTAIDVRAPVQVVAEHIPSPANIPAIPAGRFVVTTFALQALPGIESGAVDVLVQVRCPSAGQKPNGPPITGSLTLTAGTAAHLPEATFLSFPDKLNDGQSAIAAVSIYNPTPYTLTQIRVAAVDSEDVTVSQVANVKPPFVPCPANNDRGEMLVACLNTLASGDTVVLDLEMTASPRVQTGTQHVALLIASQTDTPGDPITSTVVATASVQVTIFGVDAISPFGLATLFVLPGLLTILTFLLLARYVYPRSKELPDTVQFNDPRTLLFVVPPAALAYLLVWALWGINLTNQAGTSDVALLFGLGVGLGFSVWLAVALSYYGHSGRKQFRQNDSPAKVLQRLEARNARLMLRGVTSGNLSYRYLSDGPSGKLVVCPPANYTFAPGIADPARQLFRQVVVASDIGAVRHAVRDNTVELRWQLPAGVTLLDPSAVQMQANAPLIVEDI